MHLKSNDARPAAPSGNASADSHVIGPKKRPSAWALRAIALSSLLILVVVSAIAIQFLCPMSWGLRTEPADDAHGPLTMARQAIAATRSWVAKTWEGGKSAAWTIAAEAGAPLVAGGILVWRQQAITDGSQPMPDRIREELVGYFPKALLDKVRYRIGWNERWALHASLFRLTNVRALALVDVIVFRDQGVAADPVIWAHELAHVRQYEDWGLPRFVARYLRDHEAAESEAWECAARYTMWALEERRLDSRRDRENVCDDTNKQP